MDPNQEERDNFFRMTLLLFRVGNQKLREFFKSRWPIVYQNKTGIPPPAPWTDIPNDAIEMIKLDPDLLKKFIRFNDQKKAFNSGDTNKWDFSLLTNVLSNSTLGFVTSPSPESHAIKDLKDIRNNLIGHATDAKISNTLYSTEWPKACIALKNFNATQDEIDQVEEDVKKPIDVLLPLLKELLDTEKEILDAIKQFSAEVLETVKKESEDVKETVRTEVSKVLERLPETKRRCSKDIKMREEQRLLLQERLQHFQNDITATELFEYLPCLSDKQKGLIAYEEKNYTPVRGVKKLVEELETCENGFDMFVRALLKSNVGHIAVLLDPDCEDCPKQSEDTEDASFVCIDGTAVDVHIIVRILDANTRKRNSEMEEQIALQYRSSKSENRKDLRKAFTKVLPKGIHFVNTKQLGEKSGIKQDETTSGDSIVFVFRITKESALDRLWQVYKDRDLRKHIWKTLQTANRDENLLSNMDLELLFQENDYKEIKKILNKGTSTDIVQQEPTKDTEETADEQLEAAEMNSAQEEKVRVRKVYLDGEYHREIHLREYQKELAAPAFEGNNTIICAPTNSGKTFVAMEIAKRHLDAHNDSASREGRKRKVVFAVNKQNLVLQQRARFEEYLSEYKISDISGNNSEKISLGSLLNDCEVVVLTAQILVNALQDESVKISDISLLMFDECHHTQKEEPYNKIMMNYIAVKRDNKENLPQVVGLTASLGVGQTTALSKAVEHVLEICANLDASCISTVRDNMEDLVCHVTGDVPDMKVLTVNNDKPNVFEREVNKAMEDIEKWLKKEYKIDVPFADRQREGYRQWIELLEQEASVTQNKEKYACSEQLRSYHEALLINNFTTIEDGLEYLEKCFNKHEKAQFSEICSWLDEVYKKTKGRVKESKEKHSNPLLLALESLIADFHGEEAGESKGIVFCRTKAYAVALRRWISEAEKLKCKLRPDILLGSGGGQLGLTQSEQESVIKKFKTGEVNVIIATSVAEEGLDISDCKYVIRYDVKTNEISRVQARGRIRAKEGTYVYLSDTRSRGADHELKNQLKETLMNEAVTQVQKMATEMFMEKIKDIQAKAITDLKFKIDQNVKKSVDQTQRVNCLCRRCSQFICRSYELMTLKELNRVVISKNIYENMIVKPHENPCEVDGIAFNHKIFCKGCKADWGVMITIQGTNWPCIKIKSLQVQVNDQKPVLYKQWKDYPYIVTNAGSAEELNAAQERLLAES